MLEMAFKTTISMESMVSISENNHHYYTSIKSNSMKPSSHSFDLVDSIWY
jgi:hypothetical protein